MQQPETITTLDLLPVGHIGRLGAMHLPPAEQQRMAEMGLTARTPVVVTKRGHLGGPLEIRELVVAVEKLGYRFKSKNPANSLGAFLYGPEGKQHFKKVAGGFVAK